MNQLQTTVDSQRLVGLETHSELRQIQVSLGSHERLSFETRAGMLQLVDVVSRLKLSPDTPCLDDTGVRGTVVFPDVTFS